MSASQAIQLISKLTNLKSVKNRMSDTQLISKLTDLTSVKNRIKEAYSRNQFIPIKEKFILISEVPKEKEISLREVARGESVGNGQGFAKCGCESG